MIDETIKDSIVYLYTFDEAEKIYRLLIKLPIDGFIHCFKQFSLVELKAIQMIVETGIKVKTENAQLDKTYTT